MRKTKRNIPHSLGPSNMEAGDEEAFAKAEVRHAAVAADEFSFRLKPQEIARHLGRFVIGQNEAKKVLGVALCDHFQHVRMTREGKMAPFYQKQNVLLLGPTGVGKTHLIRSAAELIGVPFVKADATKFSETGYVGGDVDDLVRDLVRRAGGNLQRAEHGIIYLDEIDKLASPLGGNSGRDVSGRGVQTNLLKLMEDGDVPLISPNDVSGQLQSALSAVRGNASGSADVISTKNILFIASGAFSGLENIIHQRMSGSRKAATLADASTADLIRYGLEPEFIGRLPVRVACHSLDTNDLYKVLAVSESSLIRQYERAFSAYGIEAKFQKEALLHLAELARAEETGARGLMTVLERTFRDIKFRLPSSAIKKLIVTKAVVENPGQELRKLLKKR